MNTDKIDNTVRNAIEQATDIKNKLYDIIWENQEGQADHFDNLPKAQRVALIGVLADAVNLVQSLNTYGTWFINNK